MVNYTYDLSHLVTEQTQSEQTLLKALLEHDEDSYYFSCAVALLNVAIIKQYGIKDKSIIHGAFKSGLLHDIGKLGMGPEFINHPGAYTFKMYEEMKNHPKGGAELLTIANSDPAIVISTALHHCNVDGSGYPGGYIDEELPLFPKLTRISDSIDAFLSKRCYKDGGDSKYAYDDLAVYKGVSYDPLLLEAYRIIHEAIIDESRRFGEDRPSREMYIRLLGKRYAPEYYRENQESLIDLL